MPTLHDCGGGRAGERHGPTREFWVSSMSGTRAPDSRALTTPAETFHGLFASMMLASSCDHARSMTAYPSMRIRPTFGASRIKMSWWRWLRCRALVPTARSPPGRSQRTRSRRGRMTTAFFSVRLGTSESTSIGSQIGSRVLVLGRAPGRRTGRTFATSLASRRWFAGSTSSRI